MENLYHKNCLSYKRFDINFRIHYYQRNLIRIIFDNSEYKKATPLNDKSYAL